MLENMYCVTFCQSPFVYVDARLISLSISFVAGCCATACDTICEVLQDRYHEGAAGSVLIKSAGHCVHLSCKCLCEDGSCDCFWQSKSGEFPPNLVYRPPPKKI